MQHFCVCINDFHKIILKLDFITKVVIGQDKGIDKDKFFKTHSQKKQF
jgi:hypothetical protein